MYLQLLKLITLLQTAGRLPELGNLPVQRIPSWLEQCSQLHATPACHTWYWGGGALGPGFVEWPPWVCLH